METLSAILCIILSLSIISNVFIFVIHTPTTDTTNTATATSITCTTTTTSTTSNTSTSSFVTTDDDEHHREIFDTSNSNRNANDVAAGLGYESSSSIDDMSNYIVFALVAITLLFCDVLFGYFCISNKKELRSKQTTETLDRYIANNNKSLGIEMTGDDIIMNTNVMNENTNSPVINHVVSLKNNIIYNVQNFVESNTKTFNNAYVELQLEGTQHKRISTLISPEGAGSLVTDMNKHGTLESQSSYFESENCMDVNQYKINEESVDNYNNVQSDHELEYNNTKGHVTAETGTPAGGNVNNVSVEFVVDEFVVYGDDDTDHFGNNNDDAQSGIIYMDYLRI